MGKKLVENRALSRVRRRIREERKRRVENRVLLVALHDAKLLLHALGLPERRFRLHEHVRDEALRLVVRSVRLKRARVLERRLDDVSVIIERVVYVLLAVAREDYHLVIAHLVDEMEARLDLLLRLRRLRDDEGQHSRCS